MMAICMTNPMCKINPVDCKDAVNCSCIEEAAQGMLRFVCNAENCPGRKHTNNCNLGSCRYNHNGECGNLEKRKECIDVARLVFCIEDK